MLSRSSSSSIIHLLLFSTIISNTISISISSVAFPPNKPNIPLSTVPCFSNMSVNATGFTYGIHDLPPVTNSSNNFSAWPNYPVRYAIPNLIPPGCIFVCYLLRPGTQFQKGVLLDLIMEQIVAYQAQQFRLPDDFYLERSNVRFWMKLEKRRGPPEQWLSMPLALGALWTFYDGVRIFGAQQMMFAAVNEQEWQAKAYYMVEFLDPGVS